MIKFQSKDSKSGYKNIQPVISDDKILKNISKGDKIVTHFIDYKVDKMAYKKGNLTIKLSEISRHDFVSNAPKLIKNK